MELIRITEEKKRKAFLAAGTTALLHMAAGNAGYRQFRSNDKISQENREICKMVPLITQRMQELDGAMGLYCLLTQQASSVPYIM